MHILLLIDHIFCKSSQASNSVDGGIIVSTISDHFMPFICLNKKRPSNNRPKTASYQVSDSVSINNFVTAVRNIDFNSIIDSDLNTNPNETYSVIHTHIDQCIKTHLPFRNIKFSKYKHKINPWITQGILRSLKTRNYMYRRLKSISPISHDYDIQKINLKTYNGIINKTIRHAKLLYYNKMFDKYKNDSRKSWKLINSLISSTKNKKELTSLFIINGETVTNEEQISKHFNTFFASIGSKQASTIPATTDNSFTQYLSHPVACRFSLTYVTPNDVMTVISKLNPKQARVSIIYLRKF